MRLRMREANKATADPVTGDEGGCRTVEADVWRARSVADHFNFAKCGGCSDAGAKRFRYRLFRRKTCGKIRRWIRMGMAVGLLFTSEQAIQKCLAMARNRRSQASVFNEVGPDAKNVHGWCG